MLHKLLAGHRSHIRSILSIMLCLALVCGTVASMSVFAAEPQTETELATETALAASETSEENTEKETEVQTVVSTESETAAESETVTESLTESTEATTAEVETKEAAAGSTSPAVKLTGSVDGVSVSVNAPEGAFTSEVSMVVSAVDVEAFAEGVVADCVASDGGTYTVYDAAAVEISFYDVNGAEVQPTTEVEVTLGNLDLNTGDDDLTKYAIIYHMNDDGTMEYIADGNPGESSYTFSASSFSTYGLIIASVEYDVEAMAGGDHGDGDHSGEGSTTSTIKVYYDTVTTSGSGDNPALTALNSSSGVSSVSISGGSATNNGSVTQANGNASSWTASTTELTYTSVSSETVTLTVTPADGYYVTFIAVCCTGRGEPPTSCTTYAGGNAYSGKFTISDMGTISVSVYLNDEDGFKHSSNAGTYFVMISVAKIPSPLYVEYDYGTIVDSLSTDGYDYSAFNTARGWTSTASGNSYGTTGSGESSTNGVMTNATQYKYTYADNSDSSSAGWAHYANSITNEAIAQAAADGYYFAGWQATYYTTCNVTETSGSYNNYNYDFQSQYGSSSDYYQPGASVPLTVHVKLVAIWVKPTVTPGSLTITKSFSGLPDGTTVDSITFTVTKDGDNSFEAQTVTLSGSNSWSQTINDLNAGTYTVTETGYKVDGYSCTTTVNGTEVEEGSASVTLTGTLSSTYNSSTGLYEYTAEVEDATVEFVNTYVVDTAKLILKKEIEGNAGVTTKEFTFTVSYTNSSGDSVTETYYLADGDSNENNPLEVKLGTTVTITEESGGYTATATLNDEEIEVTEISGKSTLTFKISEDSTVIVTNEYWVYPDTGVNLDSVPYIALLCGVVVLGAVVLIRRRKRLL